MKIKYVHSSEPSVVKIHDTEKSLNGCLGFIRSLWYNPSQEDWDKHILKRFEEDLKAGKVLSYAIIRDDMY